MPRLTEDQAFSARLALCDSNPELLEFWRFQFAERHPNVEIVEGSVLDAGADAVLCPGNAFGFMDGGLALFLSEQLGWNLQDELRSRVREDFDGELVVGQAIVHPTGAESPAWLVYAPTLRALPVSGDSLNAYVALRAALLAVRDHNLAQPEKAIKKLAVSGLCTGAGGMHPAVSARQMRHAFEISSALRGFGDKNFSGLKRREKKLRSLPASLRRADNGGAADD